MGTWIGMVGRHRLEAVPAFLLLLAAACGSCLSICLLHHLLPESGPSSFHSAGSTSHGAFLDTGLSCLPPGAWICTAGRAIVGFHVLS